jgi:hypothetical protein
MGEGGRAGGPQQLAEAVRVIVVAVGERGRRDVGV